MPRILIVDDEPLVRRGIRNCVNWNELGIEMVAEAANGVEAIAQIVSDRPDIVLLDINMPRMDGLEFADIVRRRYPQTKVVIITGYQDFEYARSALRIGVDDYVLKPVTKEEIERIVTEQLANIEENVRNEKYLQAQAGENALNGLLRREQRAPEKVSVVLHGHTLTPADPASFAVVQEYLSCAAPWAETEDLATFAVLNVADEILGRLGAGGAFRTYKNDVAFVLTCPERELERVLTEVRNGVLDFLEIPVDIGVSRRATIGDLADLAEEAQEALDLAFVSQDEHLLFFERTPPRAELPEYPRQEEKELIEHMLAERPEEINRRLDLFFEKLKRANPGMRTAKLYLLRLLAKLTSAAESLAGWTGEDEGFPPEEDYAERVDSFASLSEASDWIKECYRRTYDYMRSMRTRSGQLFLTIRAYIEKNYASNSLNLKKCSEDLYLSPNYISMIMKKESGSTFVDYLNDYRIRRAEQLLLAPGSRIGDVAEKVGFTHHTYFSSVFKKVTGMTPKQYKDAGRA